MVVRHEAVVVTHELQAVSEATVLLVLLQSIGREPAHRVPVSLPHDFLELLAVVLLVFGRKTRAADVAGVAGASAAGGHDFCLRKILGAVCPVSDLEHCG